MKFLPYDKFEVVVGLPAAQVRERIQDNIGPTGIMGIFSSVGDRAFNGKVSDENFKIHRNIRYRNSFLPILCGSFEHHPAGTLVSVRMRLHYLVMAFLVFFIGFFVDDIFPFTTVAFWAEFGQLSIMLVFVTTLTCGGFWFEAKKSKLAFLEIFKDVTANKPPS